MVIQDDTETDEARIEAELETERPKDESEGLDLDVSPKEELVIMQQLMRGAKQEYFQYKTVARMNRLVENKQQAEANEDAAKKQIKIIAQMDREIKALELKVMTLPVELNG